MLLQLRPLAFICLFFMVLFTACNDGGNKPTEVEENLVIALDPDPGSSLVTAVGSSYTFRVNISSKIPPQGVDVTTTYRSDSDNSVLFSQTVQASSSPVTITITNIPLNQVGTVTVEVKSKSKSTNTATKTFKLVRK